MACIQCHGTNPSCKTILERIMVWWRRDFDVGLHDLLRRKACIPSHSLGIKRLVTISVSGELDKIGALRAGFHVVQSLDLDACSHLLGTATRQPHEDGEYTVH